MTENVQRERDNRRLLKTLKEAGWRLYQVRGLTECVAACISYSRHWCSNHTHTNTRSSCKGYVIFSRATGRSIKKKIKSTKLRTLTQWPYRTTSFVSAFKNCYIWPLLFCDLLLLWFVLKAGLCLNWTSPYNLSSDYNRLVVVVQQQFTVSDSSSSKVIYDVALVSTHEKWWVTLKNNCLKSEKRKLERVCAPGQLLCQVGVIAHS